MVCVKKIESLVLKTKSKFPDSKIGISGITMRQDIEVGQNIKQVNKKLKDLSKNHNVSFIDNSSINNTCLNGGKLHLNPKGSAFLATNFIRLNLSNTTLTRCDQDSGICDNLLRDITKSKGIKIASLNINSLLKHIEEIRVLLTEYTFDILAINESKIDNSISDNELHIFGYDIIRKDRNMGVVWFYMSVITYHSRKGKI